MHTYVHTLIRTCMHACMHPPRHLKEGRQQRKRAPPHPTEREGRHHDHEEGGGAPGNPAPDIILCMGHGSSAQRVVRPNPKPTVCRVCDGLVYSYSPPNEMNCLTKIWGKTYSNPKPFCRTRDHTFVSTRPHK